MKILNKFNRENKDGFTIVETMIVLAIAGLILLIVLLAVPALQRSSTNSNIKSDASAIAAAVSDYESNNGGTVPNTKDFPGAAAANGNYVVGSPTGASSSPITSQAKIQNSDTIKSLSATQVATKLTGTNTIYVVIGQGCNETTNTRSIAIYYPVATGSGSQYSDSNCVE